MKAARWLLFIVFVLAVCAQPVHAEEEEVIPGVSKEKEKPLPKGQETIMIEKGGVLLPRGTLVVEPGVQYSHTSRTRISISGFTLFEAIVIGEIISEDIERNIITPSLNFRYGLTNRVQLELRVPWLLRYDQEAFVAGPAGGDIQERRVDESNLGDIEAALSVHAIGETGYVPDMVINIRGKSRTGKDPYFLETEFIEGKERLTELPTGSGHYGVYGGLTLVKTSDPAVLFLNGGYFYNFERDVGGDFGKIKPGDSVEFGMGIAYALNEKLSTSISFQQRFTFDTKQNGNDVPNSDANVASIYFGSSFSISRRTAISISVGLGLTEDAPDTTVSVRFPITI